MSSIISNNSWFEIPNYFLFFPLLPILNQLYFKRNFHRIPTTHFSIRGLIGQDTSKQFIFKYLNRIHHDHFQSSISATAFHKAICTVLFCHSILYFGASVHLIVWNHDLHSQKIVLMFYFTFIVSDSHNHHHQHNHQITITTINTITRSQSPEF